MEASMMQDSLYMEDFMNGLLLSGDAAQAGSAMGSGIILVIYVIFFGVFIYFLIFFGNRCKI